MAVKRSTKPKKPLKSARKMPPEAPEKPPKASKEKTDTPVAPKKKKGSTLFKKGVSGNPKGRPVGSVSTSVALRKKITETALDQMGCAMPELIAQAIEMAQEGDKDMVKFCIERFVPKAAQQDDKAGKGLGGIVINVTSMDQIKEVSGTTIDNEDLE